MARYTGDDTRKLWRITSFYHIRTEMDSQSVLVRQIHRDCFLGDRAAWTARFGTASDSYMGLAVGLSLSAGLLTWRFLHTITLAGRRRREESGDVFNISQDGIMDIPIGISGSAGIHDRTTPPSTRKMPRSQRR
jgi:hypothetical protein